MSRIGKAPIDIPDGVTVTIEPARVAVVGPLGTLQQQVPTRMKIELADGNPWENVPRPTVPKKVPPLRVRRRLHRLRGPCHRTCPDRSRALGPRPALRTGQRDRRGEGLGTSPRSPGLGVSLAACAGRCWVGGLLGGTHARWIDILVNEEA